jgi:hypothetical protein
MIAFVVAIVVISLDHERKSRMLVGDKTNWRPGISAPASIASANLTSSVAFGNTADYRSVPVTS